MSCQRCARQQFVKAGREGCAGLHGRVDGDGATNRRTLQPLSLRALSLPA